MTKQAVIYLLILLAGLAGGAGIGVLITQSKLDTAQASIADLEARIADQEAAAETDLQALENKLDRLETELVKARNDLMRKNTELLRAQTNVEKMKKLLQETLSQGQSGQTTESTVSVRTPPPRLSTPSRSVSPPTAADGTRSYTIKEGDSLWRIAATELGNGTRWREILEVNPTLSETSTLTVGSTILLPTD